MRLIALPFLALWTTLGAPAVCLRGGTPCCDDDRSVPAAAVAADDCDDACCDERNPCQKPEPKRSCDGCGLICGAPVKPPDEMRLAAPALVVAACSPLTAVAATDRPLVAECSRDDTAGPPAELVGSLPLLI